MRQGIENLELKINEKRVDDKADDDSEGEASTRSSRKSDPRNIPNIPSLSQAVKNLENVNIDAATSPMASSLSAKSLKPNLRSPEEKLGPKPKGRRSLDSYGFYTDTMDSIIQPSLR